MTSKLPPYGYPPDYPCSPSLQNFCFSLPEDMLQMDHDSTDSGDPILGVLSLVLLTHLPPYPALLDMYAHCQCQGLPGIV